MSFMGKLSAVVAALALCLVFAGAAVAKDTSGAKPVLKGSMQKPVEKDKGEPKAMLKGTAQAPRPVNINKATAEELAVLNGVGPVLAQRIVAYRTKHGAFKKPEDIKNVKGIGDAIYNKNKAYIKIK